MNRSLFITCLSAALLGAPCYAAPAAGPNAAEAIMNIDAATFTRMVASSNAFEIQSSQIALKKVSDGPLKDFAQKMIDDHTKAGEDFKKTLQKSGGTPPPDELAPKHAAMLKLLQDADGKDFEMLYTDMQFGAHKEAVALFMTFEKGGDDPALKDFAARTLPTLEMHLKHIKGMVETKAS